MFSIRASLRPLAALSCTFLLISSCSDDHPTKPPDEPPATWSIELPAPGDDALGAVAPLSDGSYLALGFTNSNGAAGEDFYAVRFTADGDTIWTRRYGGDGGDIGTEVVGTHDGGAVLGGLSNSFGSNGLDIWIVKVDSLGDTLWSHSFSGTGHDRVNDLILATDNSIIAVGAIFEGSLRQAWLARFSADGTVVADIRYDSPDNSEFSCVEELPVGGFFIGGQRWGGAPFASWLLVDAHADTIATGWYIFQSGFYVQSMATGVDGRMTLAGWHKPTSVQVRSDFFALRINAQNQMQWEKKYGGAEDDECHEILALPDGNLMLVGNTRSYDGLDWDLYTITIDTAGAVQNENVYKDDLENPMAGICTTLDGRYIIVGLQAPLSGGPTDIFIRKLEL